MVRIFLIPRMKPIENYMKRAFELAHLGIGKVSPNPLVGCVIVKDGKIIGEGYHQQYGSAHAEVNAVNSVTNKADLKGSQVIVSLEPCNHHGLTPPCSEKLIDYEVGEVIIANIDPNPLVNGKGIERLKSAGVKVTTSVLADEGKWLNRRFFTLINHKRPYIILKWAQTSDKFIAREDYSSKWISDEHSRKLVHKWRHEEDAILVGTNTAKIDNPRLNVRDLNVGQPKQPIRVVIDKKLELGSDLHLFNGDQTTICFNTLKDEEKGKVKHMALPDNQHFEEALLSKLAACKTQSLIIEGGSKTLNLFIQKGLWDEARIFTSPESFEKGVPAPDISGEIIFENQVVQDTLTILKNPNNG